MWWGMKVPGIWYGWCLGCSVGFCAGLVPADFPMGGPVYEVCGVHGFWCVVVHVILVLVCAWWCMYVCVLVGTYIYTHGLLFLTFLYLCDCEKGARVCLSMVPFGASSCVCMLRYVCMCMWVPICTC